MKKENGKNEVELPKLTTEQKAQQTARTIAQVRLFIEMLKGSISTHSVAMYAKKRVVMLPRSYFSIATDKEKKEYYINQGVKPEMFSIYKAKKISKLFKTKNEGYPILVTKLKFFQCRLRAAEGLLELMERSINEKPVNNARQRLKGLRKQYNELSSNELCSKIGKDIRGETLAITTFLKKGSN